LSRITPAPSRATVDDPRDPDGSASDAVGWATYGLRPYSEMVTCAHPPLLSQLLGWASAGSVTERQYGWNVFWTDQLARSHPISGHQRWRAGRPEGILPRSFHRPVAVTDGSRKENVNKNGVRFWTASSLP
jgi:hypothetical protein